MFTRSSSKPKSSVFLTMFLALVLAVGVSGIFASCCEAFQPEVPASVTEHSCCPVSETHSTSDCASCFFIKYIPEAHGVLLAAELKGFSQLHSFQGFIRNSADPFYESLRKTSRQPALLPGVIPSNEPLYISYRSLRI